jgi:hypothetical protein
MHIYTCGWPSKLRQEHRNPAASHRYNTCAVMPLITSTLKMEAETVSETLDENTILTWLIAQENLIISTVEGHKLICALLPGFE